MKSTIVATADSKQSTPDGDFRDSGGTIFLTLIIPAIATYLIWSGNLIFGLSVTTVLAFAASISRARIALRCKTGQRFTFGIDAMLFMVVSIISGVVIGNFFSPNDSKLYRLDFGGFAGMEDILPSYTILIWCLSLATLPIPRFNRSTSDRIVFALNRKTSVAMGILGSVGLLLSLTVSRYDVFSNRGDASGNGLSSLLYWSAAVFVCYIILLYRSSDSTFLLIAAAVMAVGLLATGNRSPVVLIGIAVVVRVIEDRRRNALKAFLFILPVGLFTMSYQSVWRSLVSNGMSSSPLDVVGVMVANPLQEFLHLGLDTVDGHSLVTKILRGGYHAQWLDPVLAVLNFVPRQLWADKPTLLGSTIGQDYLGLTAGGIFLSGPGYMSLVTGSLLGGSILFVAMIMILKILATAPRAHPVIVCAVFYLAIRFTVAGDAFDIFLALQVIVIFGLSNMLGKVLPWLK